MTVVDILGEIRAMRVRLDALEAQVRSIPEPKPHCFADLYGILKGEGPFTEEAIDAARYRMKPEDKW